jgi:hypothetical protein
MARSRDVILKHVPLPDVAAGQAVPETGSDEYARRCDELYGRAEVTWVAVYGDREHSANLLHLSGFDPRFEEALLLLGPRQRRVLVVGNEGRDYAASLRGPIDIGLFQGFSLMAQPRNQTPRLDRVLKDTGLASGDVVAVVGWKYLDSRESDQLGRPAWVPAFIVDTIREVTGVDPVDATAAMMDPSTGLRSRNNADQIARFAAAALRSSGAIFNVIRATQAGVSERELAVSMRYMGEPQSVHPILASGSPGEAINGLRSPSDRTIALGDGISCAVGYWGSLCCRAGIVDDAVSHEFFTQAVRPYFLAQAAWYATVGIDVAGGEVAAAVDDALAAAGAAFRPLLNPGHLTSFDEWVHSPIEADSDVRLASGMMLQCDIIPNALPPGTMLNCEDTVVLADEAVRNQLALTYPGLWARINGNRALMEEQLGLTLRPELLPLSLANAYLPPAWLAPHQVCALA